MLLCSFVSSFIMMLLFLFIRLLLTLDLEKAKEKRSDISNESKKINTFYSFESLFFASLFIMISLFRYLVCYQQHYTSPIEKRSKKEKKWKKINACIYLIVWRTKIVVNIQHDSRSFSYSFFIFISLLFSLYLFASFSLSLCFLLFF